MHILAGNTLLNILDDKSNLTQIIQYIHQFYYLGEHPINTDEIDNYISQSKIMLERFTDRNLFAEERVEQPTLIDCLIYDIISSENKKSNLSEVINFILFSNLIGGGIVKYDYKNILYKYQDSLKDIKNVQDIYLKKEFSYCDAFKSLIDNYSSNLNQLLVIIWLRKIFNIFYVVLYDDKNNESSKLFIDKNKSDIQLNIYEIKQYLAKQDIFNKYNFIDKYLSILSSFLNNIKNNKDENKETLSEIKIYISEIYHSLQTLFPLVETKIKNKIKFTLDEINGSSLLINKNEDTFKELAIINDEKISPNLTYIILGEVNLSYFKNIDGEDYDGNNSENDDYSEDYDEIEDNLMKNKGKGKDYYY